MRSARAVLVFPRDSNPYQELLYAPLRADGWQVDYLDKRLGDRRLDLLALPALLVAARLRGHRLLHLHWVYPFDVSSGGRWPWARRIAQWLFQALLLTQRLSGVRLVWTAHNVLPHEPVFADDLAARRLLLRHCSAVIAHNQATLDELSALVGELPRSTVIPHGPYPVAAAPESRSATRQDLGFADDDVVVLAFGAVKPYKGIADLLTAVGLVAQRRPESRIRVVVAGRVEQPLLAELSALAAPLPGRVRLLAGHVAEERVSALFAAADAAVAPFRAVTTSGSVRLSISFGMPVLLPRLPALQDLPAASCLWYEPGVEGLVEGLLALEDLPAQTRQQLGARGRALLLDVTWPDVAARTAEVYRTVLAR